MKLSWGEERRIQGVIIPQAQTFRAPLTGETLLHRGETGGERGRAYPAQGPSQTWFSCSETDGEMNGLHALGDGQSKEIGYRVVAGGEGRGLRLEVAVDVADCRLEYFWAKSGESRRDQQSICSHQDLNSRGRGKRKRIDRDECNMNATIDCIVLTK